MPTEITKPIVLDETAQEGVAYLAAIAGALGADASGAIKHFKQLKMLSRLGILKNYIKPGQLLKVAKESGIYVTVTGGITAAQADEDAFLAAVGTAVTHGYEFIFDGAAWHLEGQEAELSAYGITYTGTPAEGDAIVVHVQGDTLYLEALGPDYDHAVNPAVEHTYSFMFRDVLSYGALPFCPAQLLKAIAADEYPSGLPAGTYHLTLDHGAYNGGTTQDGSYQLTTTLPIPVGGGIRHSTIGTYYSASADYTKEKILTGTWTTYAANGEILESGLATTEGTSGTSLGTATSETRSYMVGVHLNSTKRSWGGSNYVLGSVILMWLTSALAGAASGAVASWWRRVTEFDLPVKTTLPGFLHGLDPELVDCIEPVYKRTLLHAWDHTGTETYIDAVMTLWQPSMTELGYGANSGVYETSPKADGTGAAETAYPLYVGATNADRIKYQGTTARYYFHRSPVPSVATDVRSSAPSGALRSNSGARNTNGAVSGLTI